MKISFIEKIAQGIPYEADKVLGYSEDELGKIERFCGINITGCFRQFFLEMGRCSGGLLGDEMLVMYYRNETPASIILMSSNIQEDIHNSGGLDLSDMGLFVFSIESETQCMYVLTKSESPEHVYQFDQNNETVHDTGLSFLEYMQQTVRVWGGKGRKGVICRGELMVV